MDDAAYLYRYFDSDGVLLYIGVTKLPKTRDAEHRKKSPWFCKVARRDVQLFSSRKEALIAERHAIATESPRFDQWILAVDQPTWFERRPELDVNPHWYTGLR